MQKEEKKWHYLTSVSYIPGAFILLISPHFSISKQWVTSHFHTTHCTGNVLPNLACQKLYGQVLACTLITFIKITYTVSLCGGEQRLITCMHISQCKEYTKFQQINWSKNFSIQLVADVKRFKPCIYFRVLFYAYLLLKIIYIYINNI